MGVIIRATLPVCDRTCWIGDVPAPWSPKWEVRRQKKGETALLCKAAIIKAAFPHCKWPFEKMSSEGEHAKGLMLIYLIKPDYMQQVH